MLVVQYVGGKLVWSRFEDFQAAKVERTETIYTVLEQALRRATIFGGSEL